MTQPDERTDPDERQIRIPRQRTSEQSTRPLSIRTELETVHGEEAEELARQQARAIRALLEWVVRAEREESGGRSE